MIKILIEDRKITILQTNKKMKDNRIDINKLKEKKFISFSLQSLFLLE